MEGKWRTARSSAVVPYVSLLLVVLCVVADCIPSEFYGVFCTIYHSLPECSRTEHV